MKNLKRFLDRWLSEIIAGVMVLFVVSAVWLLFPVVEHYEQADTVTALVTVPAPLLNHRQETWLRALEWCESTGNPEAINAVDLDGTPSYGAFQFKPSTFWYYGEKYGVVKRHNDPDTPEIALLVDGSLGSYYDALMHRDTQAEIVRHMVLDRTVDFTKQFPGCVRKLGLPPR